jgi:hypothetical protein
MLVDYAKAWSPDRGRCFRLVCTSPTDGRPTRCPQPAILVGWRRYAGRWLALDACAAHIGQLDPKPHR